MELIKYTTEWVKGEVYQGKVMIVIGVLLLIGGIIIFRNGNELMKGMLIPLGLIVMALIGYGAMQNIVRPAHIDKVINTNRENPNLAVANELNKSNSDHKIYSTVKIVWPICMVLCIGLYFIVSSDYYKGLSIGLTGLFLFLLILDSTLDYRLVKYLEGLNNLIKP